MGCGCFVDVRVDFVVFAWPFNPGSEEPPTDLSGATWTLVADSAFDSSLGGEGFRVNG